MPIDCLCVGSANLDIVANVKSFPDRDGKEKINAFNKYCGGSAVNIAVNLARLGFNTSLLAKIGNDENGALIGENLRKNKVSSSHLVFTDFQSSFAFVAVEESGARIVYSYKGENSVLTPEDIPECLEDARVTICAGVDERSTEGIIQLFKQARQSVLAPSSYLLHNIDRRVLDLSDVIILNKQEWNIINRYHPHDKIIVVTRGKEGASAYFRGKTLSVDALPTEVVDTTGAGDAFCAGFLSGLLEQKELSECLLRGCIVASTNIRETGAQTAVTTHDQLTRISHKSDLFICKA